MRSIYKLHPKFSYFGFIMLYVCVYLDMGVGGYNIYIYDITQNIQYVQYTIYIYIISNTLIVPAQICP
jgi:hypothetical protein